MAHFAKINADNQVMDIAVISNCAIGGCIGKEHWDYQEEYHSTHGTLDFPESEPLGQVVLAESGFDGKWLQTSMHSKFRGCFAGTGMTYDADEDIFITPQPYPSWTRTGSFWNAPTPMPSDGLMYSWNENTLEWKQL